MRLSTIAKYLEQEGAGAQGKTIFINHLPAQVPIGILLREGYGGTPINHELPGYRRADFMVVVRGSNYDSCQALIEQVMTTLNFEDIEFDGLLFRYLRPATEPVVYPLSVGGLYEFVVQFDAVYVIVSQS